MKFRSICNTDIVSENWKHETDRNGNVREKCMSDREMIQVSDDDGEWK